MKWSHILFLSALVPNWSNTHIDILKFNHIINTSACCDFVDSLKSTVEYKSGSHVKTLLHCLKITLADIAITYTGNSTQ
jgi:hypothetical protein